MQRSASTSPPHFRSPASLHSPRFRAAGMEKRRLQLGRKLARKRLASSGSP